MLHIQPCLLVTVHLCNTGCSTKQICATRELTECSECVGRAASMRIVGLHRGVLCLLESLEQLLPHHGSPSVLRFRPCCEAKQPHVCNAGVCRGVLRPAGGAQAPRAPSRSRLEIPCARPGTPHFLHNPIKAGHDAWHRHALKAFAVTGGFLRGQATTLLNTSSYMRPMACFSVL